MLLRTGQGVLVSPGQDMVAVAHEMSGDNKQQVEAWTAAGQIGVVSDAQAQEWLDANALVWAVVVRPWVLVQPVIQAP